MVEVPTSKATAIAALDREFEETMQVARDLVEGDVAERPEGEMSPHDALGHLAWWNWEVPGAIERVRRNEVPFWTHINLDELNAGISTERQDWPLSRLLEDLERSHQTMMAAFAHLSDEDFMRPAAYREGELSGMILLAFGYCEHYEEHRRQLV